MVAAILCSLRVLARLQTNDIICTQGFRHPKRVILVRLECFCHRLVQDWAEMFDRIKRLQAKTRAIQF